MTNSLHEMGFAHSYPTPDEERVVEKAGIFDNTLSGGKGKIVGITNDKVFKSVFGMKVAGVDRFVDGGGKKRSRSRTVGFEGDGFLDNKFKGVVLMSLVVEGGFEIVVMAFFVHLDQIGVGTSDDGFVALIRNQLSFGDEGLINSRCEDDFEFLLGVFPNLIEVHKINKLSKIGRIENVDSGVSFGFPHNNKVVFHI